MSQPDLIIHDEKDNVGVVVIEKTKKGQDCSAWIMENDKTIKVNSTNEVPLGHKIALKDLKEGTQNPPPAFSILLGTSTPSKLQRSDILATTPLKACSKYLA